MKPPNVFDSKSIKILVELFTTISLSQKILVDTFSNIGMPNMHILNINDFGAYILIFSAINSEENLLA